MFIKIFKKSALAAMLLTAAACHKGRTTRIITDNGSIKQKIEYSGTVIFNADKTGIESISDGGYLKFSRNNEELEAEPGKKGQITYEYNGNESNVLDENGKSFLKLAVAEIEKQRAKQR